MYNSFQKKHIIPVVASLFLLVGVSFKEDFFEIAKQIEIFTTLFKTVNMNYVDQTNPGELMDKAIKNMLQELDPYTVYFNEQDVAKFKINNTGEYTGIGAVLTRKESKLIVREIYKDYPADKAGLKPGDEIVQIGDVNLIDFKEDATQLLKGSKNAKIAIKYKRNIEAVKETQIILNEVDVKAVPYFGKIDEKTGYIVLDKFNAKATSETKQALEKLKEQGATQIILDLRGNPGGLLNEAVSICNLFVPNNEIIVTTKSHIAKHNSVYKTSKNPVDLEIPLAILVDGKSASASEIVAGALQDLDRAVVIGSRSFGKGLVQRPIDLTYGTQLKVTISRYYTPSGRCIQALDYSKKDSNGKVTKTEAKNFNAFKTKKGRPVFDGGGVLPDVELIESKTSLVANALIKNDAIFYFANDYAYKNPTLGEKIPVLNDADFSNFKTFIKTEKLAYETPTLEALKVTLEKAKNEKIENDIKLQYEALKAAIVKSQETELNKYKSEILDLLRDEIIKRFQYKEGLFLYYTKNNSEIKKATQLLANTTEYNKILKK